MRRRPGAAARRGIGRSDGEHRSAAVGPVGGDDAAVHGFDKAARDGKPEPGAGADLVGLLRAIELVEDVLEVGCGNAVAFIEHAQQHRVAAAKGVDADRRFRRRIFRGIVEKIEQHLFEQHGVEFEHRQIRRQFQLDLMPGEDAAGPAQRAADDFAEIVQRHIRRNRAGFELGHVEQIGDEAVEPLGFVDDGAEQLGFLACTELVAEIAQRARRAEHGGERRLQIVRDRGEQRRAQALGFGDALDAIHVLDQPDALDGERALIAERIGKAPLIRREQWPGLVAVDTHHADGAASGMHRQKQALGARQRIGAASGGAIVLPGPFRRRDVGVVENVFGRITGLHRDGAVFRQQQHDADLQHQRGLVSRRPQHVVERAGAGELAAERVERLGGARPLHRRDRLHAAARRDARHDHGDEREQRKRRDIVRIVDREGVDRRQKEKIVAQRRNEARQAATANGRSVPQRRPRRSEKPDRRSRRRSRN